MIHKTTQKIIDRFTSEGLNFETGESDKASSVRCVIKGQNKKTIYLEFFSVSNSESVTAVSAGVAVLTEDKLADALALANELNNLYPVKTVIDKQLNVKVIADFPAGIDSDIGEAAVKTLHSLPVIIDGGIYPKFAELLNGGKI